MNQKTGYNQINEQNRNQPIVLDEGIQKLLLLYKEENKLSHQGLIDDIDVKSSSGEYCCMIIFNIIFFLFIIPILCGFFSLQPNEIAIMEVLGKPVKLITKPGLHWYFPCLVRRRIITKAFRTIQLMDSSVPDINGSPLNISVVITYTVQNAIASTYNIVDEIKYLKTQASEVVRRVVSQYTYRSNDPDQVTLLKDSMQLGTYMRELINIKLELAGIIVTRMELMEISYHANIAQGMLQIQQAQAKVEARKEIVRGGVEIVKGALDKLEQQGIRLSKDVQEQMTKDLMIVVCSDVGRPQPVLNV